MARVREITIDWQVIGGRGGTSVLHFIPDPSPTVERAALNTCLEAIDSVLNTGTSWTVATEGREFEDSTGTLEAAWSEGTEYTGAGASIGNPQANAAQGLVRLNTPTVVNGRFVRGRIFIPGIATDNGTVGELSSGQRIELQAAFQALADSTGLCVWSRPFDGDPEATPPRPARPGLAVEVDAVSVWAELAILRRRR